MICLLRYFLIDYNFTNANNNLNKTGKVVGGKFLKHDDIAVLICSTSQNTGTLNGLAKKIKQYLDSIFPFGAFWGKTWSNIDKTDQDTITLIIGIDSIKSIEISIKNILNRVHNSKEAYE